VGLEILSGRADAGPAIRAVAGLLDLDFIPLRWERFDLLVKKERFFDEGIQRFLSLFHEEPFRGLAEAMSGYDIRKSGQMIFPTREEMAQSETMNHLTKKEAVG
jgi:molybdate-binding protein